MIEDGSKQSKNSNIRDIESDYLLKAEDRISGTNNSIIIKSKDSEENIEDEIDDKSFTYNLYGSVSKGVTQTEAERLRQEMNAMRNENSQILEELKEMKNKYNHESNERVDYVESLKSEIKMLQSRQDVDSVPFDVESEFRSVVGTGNNMQNTSRLSEAKPLSECAETVTDNYTIERKRNRKYR